MNEESWYDGTTLLRNPPISAMIRPDDWNHVNSKRIGPERSINDDLDRRTRVIQQ